MEGARECVVFFQGVGKVAGWVVLQPCGHLCVCKKCCAGLVEGPMCRQAKLCLGPYLSFSEVDAI